MSASDLDAGICLRGVTKEARAVGWTLLDGIHLSGWQNCPRVIPPRSLLAGSLHLWPFLIEQLTGRNHSCPRLDRMKPDKDTVSGLDSLAQLCTDLHGRRRHNGAVLLARGEEVLFEKLSGHRDLAGQLPVTSHSAFNLASVSKQFTGAAVLLLAHRGLLKIDDPVSVWLPEIFAPGATLRHLLSHTAGLCDYMDLASECWDESATPTYPDFLALFRGQEPEFKPGERFEYSNTGYALLGHIIERASNMDHETFMDENIFRPLGMFDSGAFNKLSAADKLPERVLGFGWCGGPGPAIELNDLTYLDGITGDGGIYASTNDLHIWHQALCAGELMPGDVYAQAYHCGCTNDGHETDYGFGWEIESRGCVGHEGAWAGFTSAMYRNVETGTLLVVLDNSTNEDAVNLIVDTARSIDLL
jgi:N-acyl-D-amino-acid deacylase